MRRHLRAVFAVWAAACCALCAGVATAATINIINVDSAGEGFNDTTPAAPVGGNPGTTVGQQRLNVFLEAAAIWGAILPSTVTIRVRSSFDALNCTVSSAVLGSAGALVVFRDFANAPFADTWYHGALANKLALVDLDPANDDIQARFNSSINGNPNCLSGRSWYYGFDGNEGTNVELLPVVLHEVAHGLGFSTFASATTGALFNGAPDIYTRFMLDTDVGLHWNQMTNSQRQSSAINTDGLVWDGIAVTIMAPLFLGGRPEVLVNAPAGIAGSYVAGTASFGAPLNESGVTAGVVLADDNAGVADTDGCESIQNSLTGQIALIDRGNCTFVLKAQNAQTAGAVAVLIADNVVATSPPALGGSDPSVTIPVASVTNADGNILKGQLGNGLNASLRLNPTSLAGADVQHRVFLFAPNPVQSGSSISHWDASALPDLLMEPALSSQLSRDVDLTRYLFEDIGWLPHTTDAFAAGGSARLWGATPNPFGTTTAVRLELQGAAAVRLHIYDAAGRLVRRLAAGTLAPGPHALVWDGRDERGTRVAPGVYFSVLHSAGQTQSQRVVVLH